MLFRSVSATTRAKRDRMVVVQVGAVNPRLSGFGRRKSGNKWWRGSLAWGVEKGNYPGTRDEYGIGRSSGGFGIGRRLDVITDKAADEYARLMARIVRAVGGW